MKGFARLLDDLYFTNSSLAKEKILAGYLREAPDPDRGWALAAIAGTLKFDLFKRNLTRTLITEQMDPELFALSYDYVGELSETVALAWPTNSPADELPSLTEVISSFQSKGKTEIRSHLSDLLDQMTPPERWALLKLGTRGLRIGMSARSVKRTLANMKGVDLAVIEELWHGLEPPYESLFAWIDGRAEMPDISQALTFAPVMLAHPLDEESDLPRIAAGTHVAEWKWDGIRVQISAGPNGAKLFSRTGDDISQSFPDLMEAVDFDAVIDGELLVKTSGEIGAFNDLQQRLNKKKPGKALMERLPAHVIVYDILRHREMDPRALPLAERRDVLKRFLAEADPERFSLSELLVFETPEDLGSLREQAAATGSLIEGLMIKAKASPYIAGRPKHHWYKWKRDPMLLDAVLMYAQRGHGRRSSYFSDYTFGLWGPEGQLLPIGKAYFGFTDEELKQLDRWIRGHKLQRFGPVQEVEKELVFEVAFDGAQVSTRHKSGYALRFPRISRIRWDKPAAEADRIDALARLVSS
ncbi:MAG: cisplatin damage response ATP-dependent DNA ligase [Pseudomonadota bacterium]